MFEATTVSTAMACGIAIGLKVERGNVIINFGTQVVWVGMPPDQAEQLATMLVDTAREARASRS